MKTLIFDFDGTIADSMKLVLDIAYELTGVTELSPQDVSRMRRMPLLMVVLKMRIPPYRLPSLLIQGRQRMHQRIREVKPFPGIPELLKELHREGYHLYIMSSNSALNVRAFLKVSGLDAYFRGVYGGAAVFNKAALLRHIIQKNHIDPAECYYVGDEVRDVVAASRAGVEPVAVAWGYQHRDALKKYHPLALIDRPEQLLEKIGEKVKRG